MPLSILHLYDPADDMAARYANMLASQLQGLRTIVSAESSAVPATDAPTLTRLWHERQPDIVHQHGHVALTLPQGARLVVTPHGTTIDLHHAYVVVARSPMERETLAARHPRVETVFNPLITRTTTPETCARQMARIYLRIADSDVLPLLTDDTRRWLAVLLKVAIGSDRRWADGLQLPPVPTGIQLRRLLIYAEQEGVLAHVERAFRLMALDVAPKPATESYLPANYQVPQPMPDATVPQLLADIEAHGPTLLRLVELHSALHRDDLDEEKLRADLDSRHLMPLMTSVLPLLAEQTLLTEGFMPCQPTDNHTTQRLRSFLRNRLRVA